MFLVIVSEPLRRLHPLCCVFFVSGRVPTRAAAKQCFVVIFSTVHKTVDTPSGNAGDHSSLQCG